jgi:hypothetical protein
MYHGASTQTREVLEKWGYGHLVKVDPALPIRNILVSIPKDGTKHLLVHKNQDALSALCVTGVPKKKAAQMFLEFDSQYGAMNEGSLGFGRDSPQNN